MEIYLKPLIFGLILVMFYFSFVSFIKYINKDSGTKKADYQDRLNGITASLITQCILFVITFVVVIFKFLSADPIFIIWTSFVFCLICQFVTVVPAVVICLLIKKTEVLRGFVIASFTSSMLGVAFWSLIGAFHFLRHTLISYTGMNQPFCLL